ncbi:MAG: hypothetical protein J2P58_03480, partial [Acidimicrobiaceae bacterium]|nr:hypothetical protein [Acidimicrobiaceae bacterium]
MFRQREGGPSGRSSDGRPFRSRRAFASAGLVVVVATLSLLGGALLAPAGRAQAGVLDRRAH